MSEPIEMKEVQSSMFSHVGYRESDWTLCIVYRSSGLRLTYQNVEPETFDGMMSADSIGRYFNTHIKGKYEAIGDDQLPPSEQPAKKVIPSGITDDEIRSVEPGWDGEKIVNPNVDYGVKAFDPETGHRPSSELSADEPVKQAHISEVGHWPENLSIPDEESEPVMSPPVFIPAPQFLPSWTIPENPVQAIVMLHEREGEIGAIIKANTDEAQSALGLKVFDAESYEQVSGTLKLLVDKKDGTFKLLDPFRSILHETYKRAADFGKSAVSPLDSAIAHCKSVLMRYKQEQDRIRDEEIRKERARAEEVARQQQQESSQQLTLAEVSDAIESGDTERAEELLQNPIEAPKPLAQPTYMPPAVTQAKGVSTTKKYKVDEDLIANDAEYLKSIVVLLMAVKEGKYDINVAASHLQWDMKKLNKLADGVGLAFAVPGLAVKQVENMRVRRSK